MAKFASGSPKPTSSSRLSDLEWKKQFDNLVRYVVKGSPVCGESTERRRLDILVGLWRRMKSANLEQKKALMVEHGLSLAELDFLIRKYVERVKAARSINYEERGAFAEAKRKIKDYATMGTQSLLVRCPGILSAAGCEWIAKRKYDRS